MLAQSPINASPAGDPRDAWPARPAADRRTISPGPDDLAELPVLADPGAPGVLYQGLNHRVVASELPGGGPGCEVQIRWRDGWLPALILEDLDDAIAAAIGGDADPDLGPPEVAGGGDGDRHHEIEWIEAHGRRSPCPVSEYAAAL